MSFTTKKSKTQRQYLTIIDGGSIQGYKNRINSTCWKEVPDESPKLVNSELILWIEKNTGDFVLDLKFGKRMIPTAEEFLRNKVYITQDGIEDVHDSLLNAIEAMIEFAKLHVKAALEAAAENSVKLSATKDTIRNSYPEELIK